MTIILALALAQAGPVTVWKAQPLPGTCAVTYKPEDDPKLFGMGVVRGLAEPTTSFKFGLFTPTYPYNVPLNEAPATGTLSLGDGTVIRLRGRRIPIGLRYRVDLTVEMSPAELDHLRHTDRLSLRVEDPVLWIADLPGPSGMIDDIAQCEKIGLAILALDPAKRVVPPPVETIQQWIRPDDYPSSAKRAGDTGRATALLTIAPDGFVSDAKLIGPTTNEALNQATITLLRQRARFEPAPDAGNRWWIATVAWLLPD